MSMTRRCQCGTLASVYAMGPYPGDWGDYYCLNCKPIDFTITDYINWWEESNA